MLGMFYERKCSTEEVSQVVILRNQFKRSDITAAFNFYDDTHQDNKKITTFDEAMSQGDLKWLFGVKTKAPMALARFIRYLEKLEKKYQHHEDDYLKEIFGDGGIIFHLNNIDGWHP